jgi:RHS repeat-associated protein
MAGGNPQYAFWSFGTFDDLAHNITDIYDERGKLEVHNTYGEVPWIVSFDRVTSQKLGGASDENTTVSFVYHDLNIEAAGGVSLPAGTTAYPGPYSTPDPTNVVAKPQYQESTLCPRSASCGTAPDGTCSIASYGAPVASVGTGTQPPVPTSAVVITDVHGTVRTQYYDSDANLIREVNDTTHETRDFNYDVNGFMVGSQEASGVRQCVERDRWGNPTQSTTLPAPGYGGSQTPMATAFRYDSAEQVTDVWTDLFGTLSKTHLSRDAHERIAYEEHDVKVGQPPLRTTYSYDEDQSPVGIRELPATETLPDGRVNTYRKIDPSLGGPRYTTLDVNGALPQYRYAVYDSRGRVTESGETDKPDQVHRFAVHYAFDSSNRPSMVGHRDSPSAAWVDATYNYNDSPGGDPSSIIEARRNAVYGYLGLYANTITHNVAGGASQTSCMHYSADGRLEAMILPEGNEQIYSYDGAGRVLAVLKGFASTTPTQQWAQGCSVPARPAGDPGPAYLMSRQYSAGGFLFQETTNHVTRLIHTDGFGRVIQTDGPSPTSLAVASHQVGYDSRGRVIWSADTAPQSAYAKPTMTTPGLVSMSEYEYDLTDRITVERRWLVQTGEILTLTHDYDDVHRTVTNTDRGVVSSTTLDGLGRVASGIANDGSKTTVTHYLGYDVMTTETNQGTVLTRTMQYDTRGRVTAILDEHNVPLSSTTYDDDGHVLVASNRGSGDVTHTYDDFGHLVRVHKDLLNGSATETQYAYDRNDRIVKFIDSAGSAWSTTYTGFDAPLTTTDPLGRVDQSSYLPGYSQPIGHVDSVGRHSCLRYDYDMRPQYIYDIDCPAEEVPYGPLTPMLERRSFSYSTVGQLALANVNADSAHPMESIAYSYDSLGREVDQTVGVYAPPLDFYTVHHEYPDLGRTVVTQLHGQGYSPPVVDHPPCSGEICPPPPPPPPPPPTFFAAFRESFDSMGRLGSVDLNGTRMATWTWGSGIGGPRSLAYADNTTTAYSYDARLRQTNMVVTQPQSGVVSLARVGGSALANRNGSVGLGLGGKGGLGGGGSGGGGGGCPPGVWCPPQTTNVVLASWQDAYGADSVVRMRQRAIGYNAPITDVYQIDGDARLTAETLALPNVTMPSGEVDEATVSKYLGQGQHWRYFDVDGNGNWRSTVASPTGTSVPQHNDAVGRLQAIDTAAMNADSHGNLSNLAGDPLTFTYDDFSNLAVAATNGGPQYAYSYDAADRRVIESSGTTQGIVVWDGARIIAHGDPASLVIEVPGRGVDSHVANVANGGTALPRFYHQGPDESMLAVTDVNGLVEGYTYSAYGEATIWAANGSATTTSLINNRFGFQGQWLDPGTGTYSMRARQYVPRWGRFTSPDPLALGGGPSLYSFTGSRPIAARDPSGLAPEAQNGYHGSKWSGYVIGPGIWGMGDGDWGGMNSTGGYGGGSAIPISPYPDSWISSGWTPGSLSDMWILVGSVVGYQNGEYRYTDPAHYSRMGDVYYDNPFEMNWTARNADILGLTIVDKDTLTKNAIKAGLLRVPLTLLAAACEGCSAKIDRDIQAVIGPYVPEQAAAVQQIVLGVIMAVGPVLASEIGAAAVEELETATRAVGPINKWGGFFSSDTNAAGGTVWTSDGTISQLDFQKMVTNASYNGDTINIISGVHGGPGGEIMPDFALFQDDLATFGHMPGVTVHDYTQMTPGMLMDVMNSPGTVIGGFCNSGSCLAPFQ